MSGDPGIVRLDHVGIVVADLEAAADFLGGALGLRALSRAESSLSRMAFFDSGGTQIELFEPTGPSVFADRLGDAPARLDHVAFLVADLDAAAAALAERGVETTEPQSPAGRRTCWTVPETSGGVVYQLIEAADG